MDDILPTHTGGLSGRGIPRPQATGESTSVKTFDYDFSGIGVVSSLRGWSVTTMCWASVAVQ